ncbi:MAG: hypothetical protein M3N17_06625 [Actinomycetota bacterium]|nr:hypothetical protein [Actinomycetota bacterium]
MDPKRLAAGVVGGLAGGVLFGLMLQTMGMLGVIAGLVGQDSVGVGWVVHLAIAALFGLGYAVTFGAASSSWGRALGLGAVYGAIWWVLGALLIMPAWMGMPVLQVGGPQLLSLVGHVIYGLALGAVFQAMTQPSAVASRA